MKRILFAGVFAFAAAGQAFAADLPPGPPPPPPRAPATYVPAPVPYYNWSGFYFGINGGYGFGSGTGTATIAGNPLFAGTVATSGNANGGLAGGTVGFNYQWAAVVLGLEGDFDWSGQSRSSTYAAGTVSDTTKIPWISTFRARVGYAFDRILIFGTGGVAYSDFTDTATITGVAGNAWSPSTWALGWTAGGGVEVALAPNWTAKAEYLFVQTKPNLSGAISAAAGGGTISESATINDNLIRAGVNFKFNL
jgi:outer membrane immunogenic protein